MTPRGAAMQKESHMRWYDGGGKIWVLASNAMRRGMVLQQTPAWADPKKMLEYYKEAARLTQETGVRHEVDHIVPINGASVRGLHVQDNLRVITRSENRSKRNRMDEALHGD